MVLTHKASVLQDVNQRRREARIAQFLGIRDRQHAQVGAAEVDEDV